MKLLISFVLALFLSVFSIDASNVTERLLASQEDLTLSHSFFEKALAENRADVSKYIFEINRAVLDSHMETYEIIKNLAIATRRETDSIAVNERNEKCLKNVRNRWNLQVKRFELLVTLNLFSYFSICSFGVKLSGCLTTANDVFLYWNKFLNDIHTSSQVTANQVQNLGVKVLSETSIFDGGDSFSVLISRKLEDLFNRVQTYSNEFEIFLNTLSENVAAVVRILESCNYQVKNSFEDAVRQDLNRSASCAAL